MPFWAEASFWADLAKAPDERQAPGMAPRAMVLCAGLGTRLRPLTDELPKPLVPVGGRPLLAHIAARLRRAGLSELVLNTHHLPEAFANLDASLGCKVHRVHEPEIRGTAGGVAGARQMFGAPPIVVWNGDIFVDPPLEALCDAARAGGLALGVKPRARGEGTVGIGSEGRVTRLRGERFGEELEGGDYVGVAALGERCLASLPELGCLVGDVALPELRRGGRVETVRVEGGFSDAGDPTAYLQLNLHWLAFGDAPAYVGPGAVVDPRVSLSEAVIGAGARVTGAGEVRRVVAWPGAHVEGPLSNAIVTTKGVIVRVGQSR